MLGLRFCARAFSSCGKRGPLFITVHGPLTIAASLVAEHMLQTRRLSSCGSRARLLRGTWDLPRPGLEPVSPALAGRFSTTALPGKPHISSYAYWGRAGAGPHMWIIHLLLLAWKLIILGRKACHRNGKTGLSHAARAQTQATKAKLKAKDTSLTWCAEYLGYGS